MSPRIIQEVRLILWPWGLMIVAGLFPLIKLFLADSKSEWPIGLAVFGFFGGAAIATARCFYDALQPGRKKPFADSASPRSKIWRKKMCGLGIVMIGASSIVYLVQVAAGTIVWREIGANAIEPVGLLIIIVCSTGFWTLLTRSILGGLLLTGVAQFILYLLLVFFATTIDRMAPTNPGSPRLSHEPEVHAALSWFVAGVGLSYAAVMLWLGRRKFVSMPAAEASPEPKGFKSFIQNLSPVTEFFLVVSVSFGLSLIVTTVWIIRQLSLAPPAPYEGLQHLRNDGVMVSVVLELLALGIILGIGRIRGWSLATFGLRFSVKGTGMGVLLFFAFLVIQQAVGWLTRMFFHGPVDFHRTSHLTLPFIFLIAMVNPMAEEAIESGYLFHVLKRYGMWVTVLVTAVFRGYLHATMGVSGFITMFAMGLLYGFVYWRWRQLWPLILAHMLQMIYALLPVALAT